MYAQGMPAVHPSPAVPVNLYHAEHAADLFESNTAYNCVFSDKKLRSIALLTFLQNVYRVLPVVLRMDMGLES